MGQGRFITLEGIEGAGKSSQLGFIAELIAATGRQVETTREPGGTAAGESIRQVLLYSEAPLAPKTELLLMFAARAAHLQERILPALATGKWVVSDRFVDASYAYQSAGRGLPESDVATLEAVVLGNFRPDLVLVFDLDVAEGLRRAHARGDVNRFETERVEFFERVRECYLERARSAPDRYAVLDARVPIPGVQEQIRAALRRLLAQYT